MSPIRALSALSCRAQPQLLQAGLRSFSSVPAVAAPGTTRVGWIGTGVMGVAMAKHVLAAGYELSVYTRTMAKAEPLIEQGAVRGDTPFAVAQRSDVVICMVGYPKDVRQVRRARPLALGWNSGVPISTNCPIKQHGLIPRHDSL